MTKEDMKELLDRIIQAKYEENRYFYDDPTRPRPGKPATADDLRQLDAYLAKKGLEAPADYKLFLSIYDGIDEVFGRSYALLSVREVVADEYDLLPENVEEFPSYCEFVIATGDTPNFFGFDVSTSAADGGYEVVEVDADGGEWRLKNFADFLVSYLAVLEQRVENERRDREGLGE